MLECFKLKLFEVQTRSVLSKSTLKFENRSILSTTYRVILHKIHIHIRHCKINTMVNVQKFINSHLTFTYEMYRSPIKINLGHLI